MSSYERVAQGLESVSPKAPMSFAALVMGLANAEGRVVTNQEIAVAPAIPKGATRAEYANVLRAGE